jgi:hypothetical protein
VAIDKFDLAKFPSPYGNFTFTTCEVRAIKRTFLVFRTFYVRRRFGGVRSGRRPEK